MSLPIVESLSGLQESIFSLFRSPQLHFGKKKIKKRLNYIKCIDFPLFPPWVGGIGAALSIFLNLVGAVLNAN